MKAETKIVPVEVKEGWFKKKTMHQLQYRFLFTEVEEAIINQSGLKEFVLFEATEEWPENTPMRFFIGRAPEWTGWSQRNYDSLIEAKAMAQHIKAQLIRLKDAMDQYNDIPSEDSFEL